MGRDVLATDWAFRSRKFSSSFSPPPSLLAALLDLSPSTRSVIVCGALICRLPLKALGPPDIPLARREVMLPPVPVMTRWMICCAFAVGLGPRGPFVACRTDRGAVGIESSRFGFRDSRPLTGASISRSPSRSTLPATLLRRLEIPPRVTDFRPFPVEPRGLRAPEGPAPFRGPFGAIVSKGLCVDEVM